MAKIDLWKGERPPGYDAAPDAALPTLTAYPASAHEPHAAAIVLPGGGYTHLAAHEGEPVALKLNSLGVSAFVLHYRIAPYRHPWPLADAQRAIRVVRSRAVDWNIHPRCIGVLGFSAGGHLSVSAGVLHKLACYEPTDALDTTSARPDFMVPCYPVVSFGTLGHRGSRDSLIGKKADPELRRLLSLEKSVDAETAPAFIWHTANDQVVPVENSLMLASALSAHKVPFELHVFPDGRHGLGLAPDFPDIAIWPELCARWIGTRLKEAK